MVLIHVEHSPFSFSHKVKKVTDSKSVYKFFSKDGILKTYYSDEDLVDLRTVCFPGLSSDSCRTRLRLASRI
jgi:hypothetical protein